MIKETAVPIFYDAQHDLFLYRVNGRWFDLITREPSNLDCMIDANKVVLVYYSELPDFLGQ
jgi:hypothetical protein